MDDTTNNNNTTQLWKINEGKSMKCGEHRAVFWVKPKPRAHGEPLNKMDPNSFSLGRTYQGEWRNDMKHGFGTQLWPNGDKYEGEWWENARQGHGTLWKKSGKHLRKVYAGGWQNDKRHGVGVHFYKDGSHYEGSWSGDLRHGQGTCHYANNDMYVGEWVNDKRSGFGTLTLANGDMYEGQWSNDQKEGRGIFYYKQSEKIFEGEWCGTPKCGSYLDAAAYFGDATADQDDDENDTTPTLLEEQLINPQKEYELPVLQLAEPDKVLNGRVTEIHRMRRTTGQAAAATCPSTQGFSEQDINDIAIVYNEMVGAGCDGLNSQQLQDAVGQFGFMHLDMNDLIRINHGKDVWNFNAFIHAVHHLRDLSSRIVPQDGLPVSQFPN